MTEASGLTEEQDGRASQDGTPMDSNPRHPLSRLSDLLRGVTLAAPLPSLFMAFLAGIMVARRR